MLKPEDRRIRETIKSTSDALGDLASSLRLWVDHQKQAAAEGDAFQKKEGMEILREIRDSFHALVTEHRANNQQGTRFQSRSLWVQWCLFVATFAAFVAAAYYADVAHHQLGAMIDTLAEIKKQTPGVLKGADAAKSAAETAASALRSSFDSFVIENRPYVTVEEVGFPDTPRPGIMMRARVRFRNTGKTPALAARAFGVIITAPSQELAEQQLMAGGPRYAPMVSTIEIGPGLAILQEYTHSMAYTAEQSASIHDGTLKVYVLGSISYHDIFGAQVKRESGFCYFWRDNSLPGACPAGHRGSLNYEH